MDEGAGLIVINRSIYGGLIVVSWSADCCSGRRCARDRLLCPVIVNAGGVQLSRSLGACVRFVAMIQKSPILLELNDVNLEVPIALTLFDPAR